jgi:hypothetical protein
METTALLPQYEGPPFLDFVVRISSGDNMTEFVIVPSAILANAARWSEPDCLEQGVAGCCEAIMIFSAEEDSLHY